MAETTLNTRIKTRYDTLSNWSRTDVAGKYANLVLLQGEVAICYIPSSSTVTADGTTVTTAPTALMKVGDGSNTFAALPWISGLGADVYSWAKTSTKPTYTADEIEGLSTGGTAVVLDFSQGTTESLESAGIDFSATTISITEEQYNLLTSDANNYIETTINFTIPDPSGSSTTVDLPMTVMCRYNGMTTEENLLSPKALVYTADITAYASYLNVSLVGMGGTDFVDNKCNILISSDQAEDGTIAYIAMLLSSYTGTGRDHDSITVDFTSTTEGESTGIRTITSTDSSWSKLFSNTTTTYLIAKIPSNTVSNSTINGTYIFRRSMTAIELTSSSAGEQTFALYNSMTGAVGEVYGSWGFEIPEAYSIAITRKTSSGTTTYTAELYKINGTDTTELENSVATNTSNITALQTTVNSLPTKNSYPTTLSWTDGTTAGPVGTLSGADMDSVTFDAIPAASGTVSGVLTTGAQTIAGLKTFNNGATFIGSAAAAGLKTRGVSGLSSDGTTKDALWLNYENNNDYARKVYLGGNYAGAIAVRADAVVGDSTGITTSYDSSGTVTVTANYASDDDITALFA